MTRSKLYFNHILPDVILLYDDVDQRFTNGVALKVVCTIHVYLMYSIFLPSIWCVQFTIPDQTDTIQLSTNTPTTFPHFLCFELDATKDQEK